MREASDEVAATPCDTYGSAVRRLDPIWLERSWLAVLARHVRTRIGGRRARGARGDARGPIGEPPRFQQEAPADEPRHCQTRRATFVLHLQLRGLAPARAAANRATRLADGGELFGRHVSPLLDLLDELGVSATFFVAGIAAERHPGRSGRSPPAGTSSACHGYEHRRAYRQRLRVPSRRRAVTWSSGSAASRPSATGRRGSRSRKTRAGRTGSCASSASATTRASTTRRASRGGSGRSRRPRIAWQQISMRGSGSSRSPPGGGVGCFRSAAARTGGRCRSSSSGRPRGPRPPLGLPGPLLPPVRVRSRGAVRGPPEAGAAKSARRETWRRLLKNARRGLIPPRLREAAARFRLVPFRDVLDRGAR